MRCFFLLLLVWAPVAFGDKGPHPLSDLPIYPHAKWTVAVYMNGDNNLEASITGGPSTLGTKRTNFAQKAGHIAPGDFHSELAAVGSSADVHVVALVDRIPGYSSAMDNWTDTRLYYIEKDDYPDNSRGTYYLNVSGADELDMAEPNTLAWFLNTVQTHFPSDNLFVSLWDHNWGWHADNFQEDDTSNGATMDYGQVLAALNASQIPTPVAVVGYDACVSAHIEVLHTWRPYARVFAGSQDYVGWGGIDYKTVLTVLQANSSTTADELGVAIAQSMLSDPDDHCASSLRLDSTFDDIVSQVDLLAQLFIQHLGEIHSSLVEVRNSSPQTPHYRPDEFHRDLYGVAEQALITLGSKFPDIGQVAAALMQAIDSAVTFNSVTGTSCQGGKGLTIYWPKAKAGPSSDYLLTSFARSTMWDDFLAEF